MEIKIVWLLPGGVSFFRDMPLHSKTRRRRRKARPKPKQLASTLQFLRTHPLGGIQGSGRTRFLFAVPTISVLLYDSPEQGNTNTQIRVFGRRTSAELHGRTALHSLPPHSASAQMHFLRLGEQGRGPLIDMENRSCRPVCHLIPEQATGDVTLRS